MRIRAMTASFGALRAARLELGPGLNILEAPNEGGKSTWCAFLRAMLYGIPTRERDTRTALAEKNRYQPWSGAAMEGTVELEWQGREITLRRGPRGNVPFGSFSAVYTGTGEPVSGLTGDNCGQQLLGVSREVFERTAFVGQSGAAIGESGELERRVAALVSSGEEVSCSQVAERLKKWLRRRKFNKSGDIPRLESELSVINDTLARLSASRRQAEEARGELEALSARQKELQDKLWAWRSRENELKRRRWQEAQTALAQAREEVETLSAQLGAVPERQVLLDGQGDLSYLRTLDAAVKEAEGKLGPARQRAQAALQAAEDPLFQGMTGEEALEKARADRAAAQLPPGKAPVWAAALLLLGAALALGGLIAFRMLHLPALVAAPVAGAVLACAGAAGAVRAAVRGRRSQAQRRAILAAYGVEEPEEIVRRGQDYAARLSAAQAAQREAEAIDQALRDQSTRRRELQAALLELVHPFAPEVTDLFGVSAALSRALNLAERLATAKARLEGAGTLADSLERPEEPGEEAAGAPEFTGAVDTKALTAELAALRRDSDRWKEALDLARGELGTLGDPDLFESRREECREELERRQEEYDALSLALEGLEAANARLQTRFSPAINDLAGEIFSALTGGRYEKVSLDREFEASAQERGGVLPRRALALSQGTAQQLYLAARLAICELVLSGEEGGERAPVILDDALDAFDDPRAELALSHFRRVAEARQILLFTCHSREGRMAAEWGDAQVQVLQS